MTHQTLLNDTRLANVTGGVNVLPPGLLGPFAHLDAGNDPFGPGSIGPVLVPGLLGPATPGADIAHAAQVVANLVNQ